MYHIGILQLTQNLDDAVHGFKEGLTELGVKANYHYLNADGNTAILPKLAAKLVELDVDLIFACSTPAALAATQLEKNIPVVFTPVFDPVGAGLVKSLQQPGGKVTGTAGMVKAADKIKFIQELLPNAQTIGVLYATQDSNSVVETRNFAKAAEGIFTAVELPINSPADLSRLPDLLPAKLDAVFLPIGRIIEENFSTIVYYTDILKLPIIASHAPNVPFGALGALAADHIELGKNCARQAQTILAGTSAGEIPVDIVKKPDILLNIAAAQYLSVKIPQTLLTRAREIHE
ncbi:MAG: ABC transporter substrate-binding protein [Pelosinus sp.]|nr:ABC transporter substrate-binding protein [Pelosinus sp.]